MCCSLTFGTDGTRGLCVLASLLGPMVLAVPCLSGLTRGMAMIRKPNITIAMGKQCHEFLKHDKCSEMCAIPTNS